MPFFKTHDGLNLFFQLWEASRPSQVMIVLHGHGEYTGRYQHFAARMKEEGVTVAAFDGRGSGRSEGTEAYVDSFEQYLQDISSFYDSLMKQGVIKSKATLFGHSLGGLAAFHWASRYPEKVDALILSSPCFGLRLSPLTVKVNNMINRVFPKYVYRNPVYPPHLTHDQEIVENYRKDPQVRRKITVRLLAEMIKYGVLLKRQDRYELPFPIYVLMAGEEKVVDSRSTEEVFRKIHAPRKLLKVFEGFYHEIFNEVNKEEAFTALKECLSDARGHT